MPPSEPPESRTSDSPAASPEPGDDALLAGVRSGDRSAADAVIRRYWAAIHRFASSYLHDEARAEDVAQETFTRLSDGSPLPEGPLRPWLYKVARNRCLDILRHYQVSPTHHRGLRTGMDAPHDTAGPATRAARDERQAQIRSIIENMPEEYRSVLMLKYFEGLSRVEMAEALETTEAAIKGRLVRATAVLEEELARITRGTSS